MKMIKIILTMLSALMLQTAVAGAYEDFFKAVEMDNDRGLQALLARGFDVNTRSPQNQHALYLALREPSPRVVAVLLATPKIEVNALNSLNESPLMMAAFKGNLEAAKTLIAKEADVNKTGWTPLHYAATGAHVAMIALLLEQHAYIDAESPNKTTPLMMAAQYGSAACVKLLLEAGADVGLQNEQGLSALDFAKRANKDDSAELIVTALRAKQPKGKW